MLCELSANFFILQSIGLALDIKTAEKIIMEQVEAITSDPFLVQGNGCAACHVLFALGEKMGISEADASTLLSEILLENNELDNRFIEVVETVHMKQRMAGITFAIKTREAKDRYLDSQLKNSLEELLSDVARFGVEATMRKLVLAQAALQIAQSIGIDYHAATEELYHFMRRHAESEQDVGSLISSFVGRVKK
jgi:hypothetical protein